MERALLLGEATEADLLALGITVLLDVLLSTLEDDTALLLVGLVKIVSESPTMSCFENAKVFEEFDQTRKMVYLATALT